MNIGDQHILVNTAPYIYGQHNDIIAKHITIEIVEEHHDAKGEFTGKEGTGYLAKGSDGYMYGYNYPHINEGFSSGVWVRHMPDEEFNNLSRDEKDKLVEDFLWHDVEKYQCPEKASFAVGKDFIDFCPDHQKHFYVRTGCIWCKNMPEYRPDIIMNMDDYNWAGWY